jgi:hypothetical protein
MHDHKSDYDEAKRTKEKVLISLSRWERVGVRAYGRGDPISKILVVECHSPTTEHKKRLRSQALIPLPSLKREKGESRFELSV